MKFADLHLHTDGSDGSDNLETRIRDAKSKGLSCIAITDHDTVHKGLEKPITYRNGLEIISGMELELKVNGYGLDFLAYFVTKNDPGISEFVEGFRRKRVERMKEMVDNLNEVIEQHIEYEEVFEKASNVVVRPHLAQVLVERGIADSMDHAYDEFLSSDKGVYVPLERPDVKDFFSLVHNAGGVVSLAHPGRDIIREDFEEVVETLVKKGLDGIEGEYFYVGFDEHPERFNFGNSFAKKIAKKHGLFITGGSDCHGINSNHYTLGEHKISYEYVDKMKEVWKKGV